MENPFILMVDDQSENLMIQEEILEDLNLNFITTSSSPEALALSSKHDYALALVDIQLPEMDGFELVRRIRLNEATKYLPIIFITGRYSTDQFVLEGIETGAVDYIIKPFDHRLLYGKVKVFVDLYRQRKNLELEINRRKSVEEELRLAKESAEIANRYKSEFLANISHDVRTPMNAILGMAELLSETELSRDQKNYLSIFKSAGDNLLTLLDDILDLAAFGADQKELSEKDFNLETVVEKTCELQSPKAFKKGVEIIHHIESSVPLYLHGDSICLRQILANLVDNAVKFTNRGEILVKVSKAPNASKEKEKEKIRLLFSVKDSGIGIKAENTQSIFNVFTQEDSSTTRAFRGSGAGLAVVKKMVEHLGGEISLESTIGVGSKFSFDCEFSVQADQAQDTVDFPKDWSVLIIDDNKSNCEFLTELLVRLNASVETASCLEQGTMLVQSAKMSKKPYDVILLDFTLADLDVEQAIETFRNSSSSNTGIIPLLAPWQFEADIELLDRLKLQTYLIKPIKQHHLKLQIQRILSRSNDFEFTFHKKTINNIPIESKTLEILLVDDSEDNCTLVQFYLAKTGHRLTLAENGEIAVELYKNHTYDLILMDMHMPVKDGFTATAEIRQWEADQGLGAVPIIALTANVLEADRIKSFEAGCTDYLTKPIDKLKLVETIESFFAGIE